MAKTIKFNYKNTDYTLEYTRAALKKMEADGINLGDMQSKPVTMIPALFKYSFYANHRNTSQKTIDELYDLFNDKTALTEKLAEMASDTVQTLFQEPEEKNAIKWEANF